jgi:hypothetical protein
VIVLCPSRAQTLATYGSEVNILGHPFVYFALRRFSPFWWRRPLLLVLVIDKSACYWFVILIFFPLCQIRSETRGHKDLI